MEDVVGAPGALYLPGQYFGEQCMVSGAIYPSTMTCVEPTLVLAINDVVYKSVFTNKTKLAEINIRLMGAKAELEDILMHQKGFDLLHRFVVAEHSAENLTFWTAVDKFEEMCVLLERQADGKGGAGGAAAAAALSNRNVAPTTTMDEVQAFSATEDDGIDSHSPLKPTPVGNKNKAAQQALMQHIQVHPHRRDYSGTTATAGVNSMDHDNGWVSKGGTSAVSATFVTGQRGLLDFAQKIVSSHILENSPESVNIPGLMRTETMQKYSQWTEEVQRLLIASEKGKDSLSAVSDVEARQLAAAKALFVAPKREIYNLLKKDSYMRFKGTIEFSDFITSFEPFSKQDTSVARKSSNSSRIFRVSNRSIISRKISTRLEQGF